MKTWTLVAISIVAAALGMLSGDARTQGPIIALGLFAALALATTGIIELGKRYKMRNTTLQTPHYIQAPNILIGDTIAVTHSAVHGIQTTHTGTVTRREYRGTDRVLYTAEGGELLAWNPARKPPRITLLKAANTPETQPATLPGMENSWK